MAIESGEGEVRGGRGMMTWPQCLREAKLICWRTKIPLASQPVKLGGEVETILAYCLKPTTAAF